VARSRDEMHASRVTACAALSSLGSHLHVSRQSVQQVLLLLHDRGLVREAPGRGLMVSPLDRRRVIAEVLRDDNHMPQTIPREHVILDAVIAVDGPQAEGSGVITFPKQQYLLSD
jgi:DNA-binding GntR family transcriptional regulator